MNLIWRRINRFTDAHTIHLPDACLRALLSRRVPKIWVWRKPSERKKKKMHLW